MSTFKMFETPWVNHLTYGYELRFQYSYEVLFQYFLQLRFQIFINSLETIRFSSEKVVFQYLIFHEKTKFFTQQKHFQQNPVAQILFEVFSMKSSSKNVGNQDDPWGPITFPKLQYTNYVNIRWLGSSHFPPVCK